jgi:arylsulfatase A-like enzyme
MHLAHAAADFFAERAVAEKPFYLQLGTFEPHRDIRHPTHFPPTHRPARREATVPPYLVEEPSACEEFAYFEASVRTVDDMFGMIGESLDRHGLTDDTLVIFTADHGIPFPRAKCSVYDPGLEVPLILRWPNGPWEAGTVHDAMFTGVDFVPTLCDLLGLPPADHHQGHSAAPLLCGEPFTPRDEVFAEMTYHDYYDPVRAIRTESHKLIVAFAYNKGFMDSAQQWRPRTITVKPANPEASRHDLVELYDLRADPLEHHNLANDPAHAEMKADLLRRLHVWMRETADPLLDHIPMAPMHHEALAALREA